jgi:hypothetical protein
MSSRLAGILFLTSALSFNVACEEKAAPPAPPPAKVAEAPVAPPPPAAAQAFVPSSAGPTDPECAGPMDPGTPTQLTLNGKHATLNGYRLIVPVDAQKPVVVGVLANLDEASPENLKAIGDYLAFFKAKGASAIVVDGDSGDTTEAIQGVLRPLAKSGLPVLVNIGNREKKANFGAALATISKESPNVFNLSKVREVDLGNVTFLSLPGYHDARYLIGGKEGCLYHTGDLDRLKQAAAQAKGSVVLLSHGPPLGAGAGAIDRVQSPPGNVGDPNLNQLLRDGHISFGVFANIIEAGGMATTLDGERKIPPDTYEATLYLNAGAADTTPWSMNDGTQGRGMAETLAFQDGKAAYSIYRELAAAAPAKH